MIEAKSMLVFGSLGAFVIASLISNKKTQQQLTLAGILGALSWFFLFAQTNSLNSVRLFLITIGSYINKDNPLLAGVIMSIIVILWVNNIRKNKSRKGGLFE